MAHPLDDHPLGNLLVATRASTWRASSWDRTGGNDDFIRIPPGDTATLLAADSPGCITRVYIALAANEITDLARQRLRDLDLP